MCVYVDEKERSRGFKKRGALFVRKHGHLFRSRKKHRESERDAAAGETEMETASGEEVG